MRYLPEHGRIQCHQCYACAANEMQFNVTSREEEGWRITNNPLAWGNSEPEVVVLGFSKGPRQMKALLSMPHDEVAYNGSRGNVDKILSHVGLITSGGNTGSAFKYQCDHLLADTNGRFHFGSLVRCTVERFDSKKGEWVGTGGGMLDKFVKTDFGSLVANNCMKQLVTHLPQSTKLIIMFGLGTKLNYVREGFRLFSSNRDGDWRMVNDVAYTDGKLMVVHVEHFASQGSLIGDWLGVNNHPRQSLGRQAQSAVKQAINAGIKFISNAESISDGGLKMTRTVNEAVPKVVKPRTETDGFCMSLKLIREDGVELYPKKILNRETKVYAYRLSIGSNKTEDAIELFDEDIDKLIDMVVNQGYSVRACSLDKSVHGIYGINKRTIHDYVVLV